MEGEGDWWDCVICLRSFGFIVGRFVLHNIENVLPGKFYAEAPKGSTSCGRLEVMDQSFKLGCSMKFERM